MFADEWRYTVSSTAVNRDGFPEAILDMRWKTRNVPIFQFFALYDRDLELYPGPAMKIHGPDPLQRGHLLRRFEHRALEIFDSEITMVEELYSGRKYSNSKCNEGPVSVDSIVPAVRRPWPHPRGPTTTWWRSTPARPATAGDHPGDLDSAGLGNSVQTGVDAGLDSAGRDLRSPDSRSAPAPPRPRPAVSTGRRRICVSCSSCAISTVTATSRTTAVDNVSESVHGVDFDYDGDTVTYRRQPARDVDRDPQPRQLDRRRRHAPRHRSRAPAPECTTSLPDSSSGNKPVGTPGRHASGGAVVHVRGDLRQFRLMALEEGEPRFERQARI